MARDRKRAKARQRRAAGRPSPRPADDGAPDGTPDEPVADEPVADEPVPQEPTADEPVADASEEPLADGDRELADHEIEDLKHGSAGADIARETVAAGSVSEPAGDGEIEEEAKEEIRFERERQKAGTGPVAFLRNSWAELRRVQWPDRRQTFQGTMVTLVFVVIIGMFLGGMDFVWQEFIEFIL